MANPGNPTPYNHWLGWHTTPKASRWYGQSSNSIRYLNAFLYYTANQATNPTSRYFSGATRSGLDNYQRYMSGLGFVIIRNGGSPCEQSSWNVIDWNAAYVL